MNLNKTPIMALSDRRLYSLKASSTSQESKVAKTVADQSQLTEKLVELGHHTSLGKRA
jgi:hypothetical protein